MYKILNTHICYKSWFLKENYNYKNKTYTTK